MLPRVSLLEELKKGGYEASLITTYNAYLPFYEDVVLRRLINAGVRHNVLLMDARQYAVSLASHPPRSAGRSYTLMPVTVAGAFHPKLIFLAGKNKGLVLVGSHNMTLAGFGFNRELTNLVRVQNADDGAGIALAHDLWTEIDYWLDHFAPDVPRAVKDMVRRVRDFAPWINAPGVLDPDVRLLAGRPGGQRLWKQFRAMVAGDVTNVALTGPFFDTKLEFLSLVRDDLRPQRITIAVDPKTVQIPGHVRTIGGVSLVQARQLGADEKEGEQEGSQKTSRYLHGKGIFVLQSDGGAVLAVGSANPSAPAWLADEASGNVELMIARRGEQAAAAAEALGLAAIPGFPLLTKADFETIAGNAALRFEPVPPPYRTGVAVVKDDRLIFDIGLVEGLEPLGFVIVAVDGRELSLFTTYRVEAGCALLDIQAAEMANAAALHGVASGELALKLLLHHARAIEEQERTGQHRRFREALQSLETDTPNIEAVLDYVHKIIAPKAAASIPETSRQAGKQAPSDDRAAPETLAVDVSQMKRRKTKRRLIHSGDLAYLLDTLIYGLRLHQDKTIEEIDRFGRSEEEQIGTDDDQEAAAVRKIAQAQDELLRVCHSKVGTVVNRMIAQLDAFAKGEQSLAGVTIRLLAVLAVLRTLRGCDGRVAWVEKGTTTVPKAQRLRLLEAIMFNLFEGSTGQQQGTLLNLAPLGEEFEQSDDVARLKGLVLWLACDYGLTINFAKPFMESAEELQSRLRQNAMVLALAQMIGADEVVVEEARQSIGALTSSELPWLTEIQQLAGRCISLRGDPAALHPAEEAEPGDIAVHRTMEGWDLRVVESGGGGVVTLIRLAKKDKPIKPIRFQTKYLLVAHLSTDSRAHAATAMRSPPTFR